jgi:hypothetical protein
MYGKDKIISSKNSKTFNLTKQRQNISALNIIRKSGHTVSRLQFLLFTVFRPKVSQGECMFRYLPGRST